MPQSPDIGYNLDRVFLISKFLVNSYIKENCHNSRTNDETDMKLGPATMLHTRNKTTPKKLGDDVMSENFDVIVIFLICGEFGALQKPNARRIFCITYIFINSDLISCKH